MLNIFKRVALTAIKNPTIIPRHYPIRSLTKMPQYVYPSTRRDMTITDDFHGVTVKNTSLAATS